MNGAIPLLPHMPSWCAQGQYFFNMSVIFHKTGVPSGNAVDVHSVSTRFESRACY